MKVGPPSQQLTWAVVGQTGFCLGYATISPTCDIHHWIAVGLSPCQILNWDCTWAMPESVTVEYFQTGVHLGSAQAESVAGLDCGSQRLRLGQAHVLSSQGGYP